jgi:hypothetical protein
VEPTPVIYVHYAAAGLASAACGALGRVAYVAPATVLPLAFSRFRSALNSANAAQQLVSGASGTYWDHTLVKHACMKAK